MHLMLSAPAAPLANEHRLPCFMIHHRVFIENMQRFRSPDWRRIVSRVVGFEAQEGQQTPPRGPDAKPAAEPVDSAIVGDEVARSHLLHRPIYETRHVYSSTGTKYPKNPEVKTPGGPTPKLILVTFDRNTVSGSNENGM